MTVTLYANTELVAMALIAEFLGTSDFISTTLPIPDKGGQASWYDTGFYTVASIGGSASAEVAMNNPIVAMDAWAAPKPAGGKPPWGKANNLAEAMRTMCRATRPHKLGLPGNFPDAIVFTAFFVSEPRRIIDPASYAHYAWQMQVNWGPTQ